MFLGALSLDFEYLCVAVMKREA